MVHKTVMGKCKVVVGHTGSVIKCSMHTNLIRQVEYDCNPTQALPSAIFYTNYTDSNYRIYRKILSQGIVQVLHKHVRDGGGSHPNC